MFQILPYNQIQPSKSPKEQPHLQLRNPRHIAKFERFFFCLITFKTILNTIETKPTLDRKPMFTVKSIVMLEKMCRAFPFSQFAGGAQKIK